MTHPLFDKLPRPTSARWQMLRAGIQNVWEYDDQRFVFQRGRLLLRGQNESGKTKALEVLLPFLLDASLSPQRLDPFGSTARAMRWNLLNEGNPDVTIAIGYVWLELGRCEDGTEQFLTLGAGLKARRTGPQVDDWYFLTAQRVDADLHPLDERRQPLTRAALEQAIGGAGAVYDRPADYRRALNDQLFGLSLEQYGALVDALLQLRRPQLSKQLDPAELSGILTASLPPLDPSVIGALAEGFERLDRHRVEREEYQATAEGVRTFLEVYRRYAAAFARGRSLELTRAESTFHAARARKREVEATLQLAVSSREACQKQVRALEDEGQELEERLRTLRSSDAYRAVEALDQAERAARRAQEASGAAGARVRAEAARHAAATARETQAARTLDGAVHALLGVQSRAQAFAVDCALEASHGALCAALDQGKAPAARSGLEVALRLRREQIATLQPLVRAVEEAHRAVALAKERLASAEERGEVALEALRDAEADERRAREAFEERLQAWAASCEVLAPEVDALLETGAEHSKATAEQQAMAVRARLDERVGEAALAHHLSSEAAAALKRTRDEVAGQRHVVPAAPHWRRPRPPDRPGAPLYLLCDFREDVEDSERAAIEAALEASGLLDAWVLPGGAVLEEDSPLDALLRALPRACARRTLRDVLVPGSADLEPILEAVELVEVGGEGATEAWISRDGRFALGPLHGRNEKQHVAFIGAGAREQARLKRLAELEARLAQQQAEVERLAVTLEEARRQRATVDRELAAFPDTAEALQCAANTRARAQEVSRARAGVREAALRVETLERAGRDAEAARDRAAAEGGLLGWVQRLGDLQTLTGRYELTARELISQGVRTDEARADLAQRQEEAREAAQSAERAQQDARAREDEAGQAEAHAQALRDVVGSTRDEVLGAIRAAEERQEAARRELSAGRVRQSELDQEVGSKSTELQSADEEVARFDGVRKEAEGSFRESARLGVLDYAGVTPEAPWQEWSFTDALLTARKVDEATSKLDARQEALDKALNKVNERHQELLRSLRPEIRILPEQVHGLTLYRATFNAQTLSLLELSARLEEDVAARDRLLGEEERKLFESFLTGEAHEHLRERLRAANGLVNRMNRQLKEHPTSSGMQMHLKWEVSEQAAPGTKDAVGLLLKNGALLSDLDREALLGFLRERLEQARARSEARTLQEQLLSVLDYRAWHVFLIEFRNAEGAWKRLTKKVHAAGSGGQKAVMLHLPLFAAAAAFYDSARPTAPRLILLDEAFAGIDRETRGQLMGLLSEFDLDFVMTSFEEWGFYPQLDGLSTYHLAREKGMRGVFSDWFIWNGQEATRVEA